jgi:hypothetical protein
MSHSKRVRDSDNGGPGDDNEQRRKDAERQRKNELDGDLHRALFGALLPLVA